MFLAEASSSGCLHQERGLVAPCAQDLLDLHAHTFLLPFVKGKPCHVQGRRKQEFLENFFGRKGSCRGAGR